jgi:hypothetical protein
MYRLALPCTRSVPSPVRRGGAGARAERISDERGKVKATSLKCAVLGSNPVARVVAGDGISSYGAIESSRPYLRPVVLHYEPSALGQDPGDALRHEAGGARRARKGQSFPSADAHDGPACVARGPFTVRGLGQVVACVKAMSEVLRDRVGLPPDCGPGWTRLDRVGLVRRLESCLPRLENLLSGDYVSSVSATSYQRITRSMMSPSAPVNNSVTAS